jgi:hypothetical protein
LSFQANQEAQRLFAPWLQIMEMQINRALDEASRHNSEPGTQSGTAGRQKSPTRISGSDEVAEMGRVVEVFRKNTLERDELLAEKAQAAERLEHEVKERTAELAQSVEELRALGDVSQAVNSTIDLQTVLSTIVAKAVQLSDTEAGTIYVFDEARQEFGLRATYGMDDGLVAALRDLHLRMGETVSAFSNRIKGAPNHPPRLLAVEPTPHDGSTERVIAPNHLKLATWIEPRASGEPPTAAAHPQSRKGADPSTTLGRAEGAS